MGSTLSVTNLQGLTSGNDANTINVSSGHTLYAPGHVIQIVEGTYDTQVDIGSTSYADLALSATITPKSSSSKIFAITNIVAYINGTGLIGANIVRGSTQIVEVRNGLGFQDNAAGLIVLTKLDSPNTTSATTYKVQIKKTAATGTLRINQSDGGSRITLMEIAQ